jgi:hypothetical protein
VEKSSRRNTSTATTRSPAFRGQSPTSDSLMTDKGNKMYNWLFVYFSRLSAALVGFLSSLYCIYNTRTPWPQSANEVYRPSDRRLSAKLVPTFADIGESRSQRGGSPTAVISVS